MQANLKVNYKIFKLYSKLNKNRLLIKVNHSNKPLKSNPNCLITSVALILFANPWKFNKINR